MCAKKMRNTNLNTKNCLILVGSIMFGLTAYAANEITCTPSTLGRGDKLKIVTSKAFGDLAVKLPYKFQGGDTQFLTEIDPKTAIIDSKKFMRQRGLEIDVDTANFNGPTKIFSKDGAYKFVVSTNLETDDGTPKYECKVKFSSTTPPKRP